VLDLFCLALILGFGLASLALIKLFDGLGKE
jgi:hypothetical protein